jgi:glycogen debranching enzyme
MTDYQSIASNKGSVIMEPMNNVDPPLPRLLPGEKVVYVKHLTENKNLRPSGLHELYRLAQAKNQYQVGKYGPVLASQALEGHRHASELHRYEAIFGRDSLRVALDLLEQYPKLTRATLVRLAELQGVTKNADREEEPGRIIHEARDVKTDPLARRLTKTQGWGWPYYGSVDATVEFIRTMHAYCHNPRGGISLLEEEYTGRDGLKHTIADSLIAAVNWLTGRLDSNNEGLLEFKRSNPQGIENQAWKDSWDAYCHSDGKIANHSHGVASIEVQRVAHDALLDAAGFYRQFNKLEEAEELVVRAKRLHTSIVQHFWTPSRGGYFVLGTDRNSHGGLRKLSVRTSNMGHMLRSPYLLTGNSPDIVLRREAVIRQLFSPEMLNVSGIRTLATDEYRFRPEAYHNGSVWLWDTYLIAQGLDAHGYHGLAYELEKRLHRVIAATHQFPEFVRGDNGSEPSLNNQIVDVWDEQNKRINRVEQPPQEVQAWTVAAILDMEKRRKITGVRAKHSQHQKFENEILKTTQP